MRYPDIKICAANDDLDSTNEASQKNEENKDSAASELKDFTEENGLKDFTAGV